MGKFRKIAALLLALAMCLGLAACGGTGGTKAPSSANAPTFDVDVSEYSELKDVGTDHIPVYPAVLCDGTLAMPYGTVRTQEIGYTGEMEEVGSSPTYYSAVWNNDSERRLEDVPISNASGLLLTLNSNIDAAYIFPFDMEQHISAVYDELIQASKDSITAYADILKASPKFPTGLDEEMMEILNVAAKRRDNFLMDKFYLDIVFSWPLALMKVLTPSLYNLAESALGNSNYFYASVWLSTTGYDQIDDSENLSALKRLLKSFDPTIFSTYALNSQTRYIYYDEAFQVTASESSSDGAGYILRSVDFASMDGFTFGGMALDTSDNVIRVFGVPDRAELYWGSDSESSDTANAYLPYATYHWEYAHVNISMECEPVINGGTATLSPSTLQISCH